MKLVLAHMTRRGPLYIGVTPDGRFHPVWQGEDLGSYISAEQAIDDAAGGHQFTPSDGTDLGELGISADIGDWVPASTFEK
jgi:hypothetical protein